MPESVTDVRSNSHDQIAHAVSVIGRSKDRLSVFLEIHRGKNHSKTVSEISDATGLLRKRVLEETKKLHHKQLITRADKNGEIAYARDSFLYAHKDEIVRQIKNPVRRKSFPTKYSSQIDHKTISIKLPRRYLQTATISIDEIDSFKEVKKIFNPKIGRPPLEKRFKNGIQKIIGQRGVFKDWGGEQSDLYSTRLILKGVRKFVAFAFKGRATKGVLTPAKLGKNGDQIQRLFTEDAEIFFIQYYGKIASSVIQQMAVFAQTKSLSTGKKIYYGIIDDIDSARLIESYSNKFK